MSAHVGVLVEAYEYSVGAVEPLERHVHATWQFAWSPDSAGEHWLRGKTRVAPPGAISIIRPGEVHAPSQCTWVDAPASFMMAYLDEGFLAGVSLELDSPARRTSSLGSDVITGDKHLSRLFARAHRLSFNGEPLARDVVWLAFLTRLLARHADSRQTAPHTNREPRAVACALDFLHSRLCDRVTLTELASVARITPARLCRAFAHRVGLPPHAYQLRLRIERAKRLLLDGHPVAAVAATTGFADQSHLGRYFRRIVGMPPSTYRTARRSSVATVLADSDLA